MMCAVIFTGNFVLKKMLFLTLMTTSTLSLAGELWHCTTNNAKMAVWNWYGKTQLEAKKGAQKACMEQNDHRACPIVCFPPQTYYRCYSHDTLPDAVTKDPVALATHKQGTWYWASFSKQIAINGAKDACRHNSPYGGCFVDDTQCVTS